MLPYTFALMDEPHAQQLLKWRYEGLYAMYNPEPSQIAEIASYLVGPANRYWSLTDANGMFVAFCCFGHDAQVPGGAYDAPALDVGWGVRPDLTGQGRGATIVGAILDFARDQWAPPAFRATVAAWNARSQRVCEKTGFHLTQRFKRLGDGEPFVVFVRSE